MEKSQKKSENIDFFKNIKVIGFDFDNTLADEQYSIKQRWKKVFKGYSFLSPNLEKKFFEIYNARGPNYKFHLDDTLKALKIDKKFKQEVLSKLRETFEEEKLIDGAKDLLQAIKKMGFKMIIITDGKQSYQESRIKKAGIYDYFNFIFYGNGKKEEKPTSGVLGNLKKYLNKISVRFPEEFLYMGDNFLSDVEGFLNLGVKVCWVTDKENNMYKNNLIVEKNLKSLLKHFK